MTVKPENSQPIVAVLQDLFRYLAMSVSSLFGGIVGVYLGMALSRRDAIEGSTWLLQILSLFFTAFTFIGGATIFARHTAQSLFREVLPWKTTLSASLAGFSGFVVPFVTLVAIITVIHPRELFIPTMALSLTPFFVASLAVAVSIVASHHRHRSIQP